MTQCRSSLEEALAKMKYDETASADETKGHSGKCAARLLDKLINEVSPTPQAWLTSVTVPEQEGKGDITAQRTS